MSEVKNCALLRARPLATRPDEIMPKGKGKGGRRGGETKAERARQRALARELPAIKERHRERCRRIQRRCVVCARVAEDTDRPFPTCHCGKRRYCGEACQVKDWYARHAKTCKSGYLYLEG